MVNKFVDWTRNAGQHGRHSSSPILCAQVAQSLDKQLTIQDGLLGTHDWWRSRTVGSRQAVKSAFAGQ
jgi:hypothetical protein